MNKKDFHNLHEGQTQIRQHWKHGGIDECVGYKYIEKGTNDRWCCVFLPTHINPDDYLSINLEMKMNKALDAELGNVL